MIRQYKIRGTIVSVEELEGVRAIKSHLPTIDFLNTIQRSIDPEVKLQLKALQARIPDAKLQLKAFSESGWMFVRPTSQQLIHSDKGLTNLEWITRKNNVYKDQDNNILLETNYINLKLSADMTISEVSAFLEKHRLILVRELKFATNLFEVRTNSADVIGVVNLLSVLHEVIYAEPQMLMNISHRLRPDDPAYDKQWHLNNDGSNGIKAESDIRSEAAWEISKGLGIKVAIVDRGFDVLNPDIEPALIKDLCGYFIETDSGVRFQSGISGFPESSHGTGCAGMAIARQNGSGGCGIAFESEFIAIACLNDKLGTQATLARAISYAADPTMENSGAPSNSGADVISCSIGPSASASWRMESVLEEAIRFAVEKGRNGKGCPVFWAVSNGTWPIRSMTTGVDEIIASSYTIGVGRSTSDDKEDGSAYGPDLDFLAPGVNVYTIRNNTYGPRTGTSFATPLAAGAAAVLLSKKPGLTWKEVRDILQNTCDKVGDLPYVDGRNDKYGYGRINLLKALQS